MESDDGEGHTLTSFLDTVGVDALGNVSVATIAPLPGMLVTSWTEKRREKAYREDGKPTPTTLHQESTP